MVRYKWILRIQSVRKPDFGAKSGCSTQQSPCTLPVMAGMMMKTVEWWVLFVKSANRASLQVSAKMILGKQCWICSQSFVSSVFTKQRDCFRSFSWTSSSTKKLMDRTFLPMVLFLGELSEIGDPHLQIFQLCVSYWTSSFDVVLLKKFLQENKNIRKTTQNTLAPSIFTVKSCSNLAHHFYTSKRKIFVQEKS